MQEKIILNNTQKQNIESFIQEIKNWNGLDLVAKSTVNNIWHYHINDALDIAFLLKNKNLPIVDFGAGNGIISFVLNQINIPIIAIERNLNKLLFMQTVAKVEAYEKIKYNKYIAVVKGVGRVLYLLKLLQNAEELVLIKSENYLEEIKEALVFFQFQFKVYTRSILGVVIHIYKITSNH